MLAHLQKPLTRRPSHDLFDSDPGLAPTIGGGEGGRSHRPVGPLAANPVFTLALLLTAVLAGLATVALR
ncbi:hypothetical protein [Actinoplanes sp. L3-i22]|uniref:hypothetical protein n=1 Tax=Actinoplanes sp. L3-i22 TaxID=2836373 RepID=UPI001C765B54|nr:hypothetical protein [Actinoplanes sp. L3-i22]BCY14920.1 hypothetical protein L3i22_100080 [Actinoplanes sp. L3-i22]